MDAIQRRERKEKQEKQIQLNLQLFTAVKTQNLKSIMKVIGRGADIHGRNEFGKTPLMMALEWEMNEAAEVLIMAGAHIDVFSGTELNHYSRTGETPLMVAMMKGNREGVQLLLQHKADIDLHTPYEGAHQRFGIDGTLRTGGGQTALSTAVFQNKPDYVKLLLDAGATWEHPQLTGGSPFLTQALNHPNREMRKLFKKRMEEIAKPGDLNHRMLEVINENEEFEIVVEPENKKVKKKRK